MASDATRVRRLRLVASLLVASLVAPAAALAQSKSGPTQQERDMARALMDEGNTKFEAKDYEGALRSYRAAHTIMNVPTTGIEVARAEMQLGKLVAARRHALDVASMPQRPGGEPKPFKEAREEARKMAADLDARIPTITVVVEGAPADAPIELELDGALIPSAAARAPQPVDPGKHAIVVSVDGMPPASRSVEVRPSERATVKLVLGDSSAEGKRHISSLVYIGFGVGGAGLIAGAITGALSLSHAGAVHALCPGGTCPTQAKLTQAKPDNDAAWTLANVSNVALAVGVVGVGVGVAGLFLSGRESKKAADSASIELRVGPSSVGLAGRF
jgi:hypothetical protein